MVWSDADDHGDTVENKRIDKINHDADILREFPQNTRNFLIKTNFIHIHSISIGCFIVTLYCIHRYVSGSCFFSVRSLCLRGWSWWHTNNAFPITMVPWNVTKQKSTMALQHHHHHTVHTRTKWNTLNELCIAFGCTRVVAGTVWLYAILYKCDPLFIPLAVLVFIQSV